MNNAFVHCVANVNIAVRRYAYPLRRGKMLGCSAVIKGIYNRQKLTVTIGF